MSSDQLPPFYDSSANYTAMASNVLSQICGERLSDACDKIVVVGSKTSYVSMKICGSVLSFIVKAILMLVTIVSRLVCRGELKTTCDAVATFGARTSETVVYMLHQILSFTQDVVIPASFQAADVTKEFARTHAAPVISQTMDLVKDNLDDLASGAVENMFMLKNQTHDVLMSYWNDTATLTSHMKKIDLTELSLSTIYNDLIKTLRSCHPDIKDSVLLPAAAAGLVLVVVFLRNLRRGKQPKPKLYSKRGSLDTQSGFLNWDDDLDDDDDQTIFTSSQNRKSSLGSISQELPAASFDASNGVEQSSTSARLPYYGPSATTLTFRAYAPPSIDKEIPKVDIMGTLQFVKTGKVRTFVHQGARRLLVLNLQDMTVELYFPKPLNDEINKKQTKKTSKRGPSREKKKNRQSGIHLMSTRNLMDMQNDESDDSDEDQDGENDWDFLPNPMSIKLSDLISVSAEYPHQSSVLQVLYKLRTSKVKSSTSTKEEMATNIQQLSPPSNDDVSLDGSDSSSMMTDHLHGDAKKTKLTVERRREFAFLSPHEAADFQHIVLALRASGEHLSQLYEMLEELHVNTAAYYPTRTSQLKQTEHSKEVDEIHEAPRFLPPGIALDDAWRSLNGIPHLREGLLQYHQYSHIKSSPQHSDLIATAASNKDDTPDDTNYRKRISDFYSTKRNLLGIVDFVYLFVNPLPPEAIPYRTPCGAPRNDLESYAPSIEVHHQRLESSCLLQQLVKTASLYIIAYYRAKLVVNNGWQLLPSKKRPDEDESADATNSQVNLKRLAFDNDRENWAHDATHRNEFYEPSVGKDVCVMVHGNSSDYQGYALVGIHNFRLAKKCDSHSAEDPWLQPEVDPVECIPSLREVIDKHRDLHFFVVMYFNYYSGIASCHLYVRSLPVGVDTDFDSSVRDFQNSPPQQKKLQVAIQLGFDEKWSLLKRAVVRTVLSVIFRWFFRKKSVSLNKGLRERLACPPILARHFANIRYFPHLQRYASINQLKNYTSITVQDKGNWKNWLIKRFGSNKKNGDGQGLLYDYSLVIKDDRCRRALTSARIVHLNPQLVAMPVDFREEFRSQELADATSLLDLSTVMATNVWSTRRERNKGATDISSDELYSSEIDAVFEILDDVKVPMRSLDSDGQISVTEELVRLHLSRSDIERYLISCACDVRAASVRLIQSCSWRGQIFPVDRRRCKVELHSGQFFQQGKDRENNPIFYFRHFLVGPDRGDSEASILAVLYRLETYFRSMALLKPGVKVTAIILMGDNGIGNDCNPMIDLNLGCSAHGSIEMFTRLIDVFRTHYPERLSKALIIPAQSSSGKWTKSKIREYLTGQHIDNPKIKVLNNLTSLTRYVKDSQLVTFAGGKAPVAPAAFSTY